MATQKTSSLEQRKWHWHFFITFLFFFVATHLIAITTSSSDTLAAQAASEKMPQVSASILRTQLQEEKDLAKRRIIALRLAAILLTEGEPEEALNILNTQEFTPQEKAPSDPMVLFWKAQALLAKGEVVQAQALLENFLTSPQLPPHDRDAAQIALARIDRNQKNYEKALAALDLVPTDSPLSSIALQERAAALLALNRATEAEALLQHKPELLKEPRLAYLFGLAAWQQGNPTEALERWSTLSSEDAWVSSAALSGIIACDVALHQPAQAQAVLEKYLQENPKSPRLPELMAQYEQLLLLENKTDATFLRKWSQDTTEPTRASYALLPYVRFMRRLGHYESTDQLLTLFLTTHPHHPLAEEASLELAENKLLEGDPNTALAQVPDQLGLTPAMQAQYAFERGLAETALSHLENADRDFGQAATLDPHLATEALYNQQLVQKVLSSPQKRVPLLALSNAATNQQENATPEEKAEYSAVLDADKGDRKSALAVVQAARLFLKTHPDSPFANEIRMKLGEALVTLGNVREARIVLEAVGKAESSSELGRQALLLAAQAASRSMDSKSIDDALMLLEEVAQSSNAGADVWQARLEQASLKNAQALPLDAIAIDDQILAAPDAPLEIKKIAQMAKGDSLSGLGTKDPANYRAAIAIWRDLAEAPDTPVSSRNQALCKIGLIEEKLGDTDAALAAYYEAMQGSSSQGLVMIWHDKAAFEAAHILEERQQWSEAIRLYQQIVTEKGPRAAEAQARISKLRLENFLWEK